MKSTEYFLIVHIIALEIKNFIFFFRTFANFGKETLKGRGKLKDILGRASIILLVFGFIFPLLMLSTYNNNI